MGKRPTKQARARKRPAVTCAVARIARRAEQIRLATHDNHASCDDLTLLNRAFRLDYRMDHLLMEASYHLARSAVGAAFQLMVADATYHDLIDSKYASEWHRKRDIWMAERCIYSALRYLESLTAERLPELRKYYLSPWCDQHDMMPVDLLPLPEETEQPAAATVG